MKYTRFLLPLLTIAMTTIACNSATDAERQNPLLAEWNTPYGIPPFDQIRAEDYLPAFEVAMEQHKAEVEAIVANPEEPTFENTILALDNAGELLTNVSNTFFLIAAADTNSELQKIEAEISPRIAAHSDEVMMNPALFERVKKVYTNRKKAGLDALQLRLTEETYKSFERSGSNLEPEQQAELAEINRQLSEATVKYAQNLLAANASYQLLLDEKQVESLPSSVKNAARDAAEAAGATNKKYLFTLSSPSIFPFLTYSNNRELRQEIYTAYIERCNGGEFDNTGVINDIIRLRTRRAQLLGFKSHAHYVLDNVMAKTPKAVYELLDELWEPALNSAEKEMEDMRIIKLRDTHDKEFAAWDWWYYAERLRKQRYNLDEQAIRPYLSLDNVRQGIFGLCNRLYGITFSPVSVPAYNKECSTFKVEDTDGTLLGVVIFDFFPRAGKSGGAWCGEYVSMSMKDGKRVAPVVTVVCNFPRPSGNTPSLLSIDETQTFFHEFGHALHNLFAQVPYKGLAGVERDFVELPSQIMENWAMEPAMLKTYAIHYQTGAVIPDHIIERITRSGKFNQGFMTTELIAASLSDMDIHTLTSGQEIDVNAFEKSVLNEKRGLIEQIAPRYRYPYFSHIFDGGYSSGYYSYLWAEVLDKDAYQAFVESGDLFDKETAARFRTLLASGGTKDGMDLYRDFRGAEPSRTPLLIARGLLEPESELEGAETSAHEK